MAPIPDPLSQLPGEPGDAAPLAVRLTPAGERAVRAGHPWVFEKSIRSVSRPGRAGDVAVIFDRRNRFAAVGLFDPSSFIRVRILQEGRPAPVGPELFRTRLDDAMGRRADLRRDPGTTGYRLLHGAGDGLPGLVLDRYGDGAVLKLYSAMWLPWLRSLVEVVVGALDPQTLVGLVGRRVADDPNTPTELRDGAVLHGRRADLPLPFLESEFRFEAHPLVGHKTGFYLDQRENRRRVEGLASGARVLNVFSYSGGFSVYAARGGAREVWSVDRAEPALEQARRHFDLNRRSVDPDTHRTVAGDAFHVLADLGAEGHRFDLVVVDPPSFAREASQVEGALKAYRSLTRLGLGVLRAGGLLVQASCSSRVPAEAFFRTVHDAARRAGRALHEEERTEHPEDHPAGFSEGAYLKCLFARAG